MLKKTLLVFGILALSALSAMAGNAEKFKLIHVTDLDSLIKAGTPNLAIFDANNDDTRNTSGIIPGAKLLSSSKNYDVASTLPQAKDSKLVFYCANTKCMASHAAAERAVKAGYTDVNVMADGIQGWVKAGEKTQKPSS